MTVTAEMMSRMPSAMLRVNGSPKMAMLRIPPLQVHSSQYGCQCGAYVFDGAYQCKVGYYVGTNASITRLPNVVRSGMACNPIPEISVPVNNRIPPNKKT